MRFGTLPQDTCRRGRATTIPDVFHGGVQSTFPETALCCGVAFSESQFFSHVWYHGDVFFVHLAQYRGEATVPLLSLRLVARWHHRPHSA